MAGVEGGSLARIMALIPAGGVGVRSGLQRPKQFFALAGEAVLSRAVRALEGHVDQMVVAAPEEWLDATRELLGPGVVVVAGGATRFASVHQAWCACSALDDDLLCIHDAARPWFDPGLLNEAFHLAAHCGAVVFGRPASDTIKEVDEANRVVATLDRARIWSAQTPQIFQARLLREGYARFGPDAAFTDEAGMVERLGHPVAMLPANPGNIKMTHPEDFVENAPATNLSLRMGHGYDVHRFDEARPLVLCGVKLPEGPGLLGHSDADVALHALMDAILGAVGEGDIGVWFPDSDGQYANAYSADLFSTLWSRLRDQGWRLVNADLTLLAQVPRLAPHREAMRQKLAELFGCPPRSCNVKATTTEGLGFVGEKRGMAAHAVVLLQHTGGEQ